LAPLTDAGSKRAPQPGAPADAPTKGGAAPGPNVTLRVDKGSLTLRSAELAEPITARRFDMTLRIPSGQKPMTWQLSLAEPSSGDDSTLVISGQQDRTPQPSGPSDLAVKLEGRRWPLVVSTGGLTASGRVDGNLDASRRAGQWNVSGKIGVL